MPAVIVEIPDIGNDGDDWLHDLAPDSTAICMRATVRCNILVLPRICAISAGIATRAPTGQINLPISYFHHAPDAGQVGAKL
jgi:hypothetical protein